MSVVFTEYGPYRPLSDRLPAFLETYPPSHGYGIEIEVSDLLAIKPGLRVLYEAAIKAGVSNRSLRACPRCPRRRRSSSVPFSPRTARD